MRIKNEAGLDPDAYQKRGWAGSECISKTRLGWIRMRIKNEAGLDPDAYQKRIQINIGFVSIEKLTKKPNEKADVQRIIISIRPRGL